MSNKCKSWVRLYAKRQGNKAYCDLCTENENNEFCCIGGTTGSLGRHLKTIHGIKPLTNVTRRVASGRELDNTDTLTSSTMISISSEVQSSEIGAPIPRKRRRTYKNQEDDRICNSDKTEQIHQALAKMIALNQMPLSFCSNEGFKQFMTVVEPNYKICKEGAIKSRLKALKSSVKEIIQKNLRDSISIACTSDCWSSISQQSYITVSAHIIDNQW